MRRNSSDKKDIIVISEFFLLIIYQVVTSIYGFLTPLLGICFCYLVVLKTQASKQFKKDETQFYLLVLYIIFIELNKGFYLFSSLITLFLFFEFFSEWINSLFKNINFKISAYVISGYVGIYGINNLFAYILNEDFFHLGFEYIFYICSDILLSIMILGDRKI